MIEIIAYLFMWVFFKGIVGIINIFAKAFTFALWFFKLSIIMGFEILSAILRAFINVFHKSHKPYSFFKKEYVYVEDEETMDEFIDRIEEYNDIFEDDF